MSEDTITPRQAELNAIVENPLLLTTTDNPYNPHTQFIEWNAFDVRKGYNTCAYLARIVCSSHELSESDEALAINQAIQEILEFNVTGNYVAVTKENFKSKMRRIRNIRLAR